MNLVWALPLGHADKLLLLALADRAAENGECFILLSTLAEKCGMHRATILRSLRQLEADGHLTRRQRPGRSTVFEVHPSRSATSRVAQPVAESDPSQSSPRRVGPTDLSQSATDPSRKATDQSQPATHIHLLSVSHPSSQSGEDARANVSHETSAEDVFAELTNAWKTEVAGVNVPELHRFFEFCENRSEKPKRYSFDSRKKLAEWLSEQGDQARQSAIVDQSIRSDHVVLYPLKDRPNRSAADAAHKRKAELALIDELNRRAGQIGCKTYIVGTDVADFKRYIEREESAAVDARRRCSKGPQSIDKLLARQPA